MTQKSRIPKWFVMLFPAGCLWALGLTASGANTASFVKIDSTTQGHWHDGTGNNRIYGGDGYWLINCTGGKSIPGYATVVDPVNNASIYAGSDRTDIKCPLRPGSATHEDGIWYQNGGASFTFEMTLSGKRQIALYGWDWDGSNHGLKVEVLDGDSNAVLDTQTTTDYGGGKYFVWLAEGHVKFRVSGLSGTRPFASALFFDTTLALLANGTARNIQVNSADITGTISALGAAPTTMYLYWATNDCTNSAADWIANGGVSNLGSYAAGTTFTNTLTGLSSNTLYYFNHMASNLAGEAWASLGASPFFRTLGGAPGINNGSGARPLAKSAVLSGALTNGSSAHVWMALWEEGSSETNLFDFGLPLTEGPFSTNVSGLKAGTLYHYRGLASNDYGTVWADTETNFSTYASLVPSSGNVTWSGGAGASWSEWCFDTNWLGGFAPTNPTTATVFFKTNGQSVVGVLDQNRTVGSLSIGDSAGTISHTLDLGGYMLKTRNITTPGYVNYTFAVRNGTLQVGDAAASGNITIADKYSGYVIVKPGAQLVATNLNSLTIGIVGWGEAGSSYLDLRGATLADGLLGATNLYLYTGCYNTTRLLLDNATVLSGIKVVKDLVIGYTSGPGTAYIGNPSDSRLPPNVSLAVGLSPERRGSIVMGRIASYGYGNVDCKLVATRGGRFTGYLSNFDILRYEAGDAAGNNRTANPHSAAFDIGNMESCLLDVQTLKIGMDHYLYPPLAGDNLQGALTLCPGLVTARTVQVGSTVGSGWGRLSLSNTMFVVTNSFTLNKTGQMTIQLGAEPRGLDLDGIFADTGIGSISVKFLAAPAAGTTNWAIRIKGNAMGALAAMAGASPSRLTSTGTFPGKKAGLLYDGVYTYYALVDESVPFPPIASAHNERTYEIAPGGTILLGTNDINNGSFDPAGRPITVSISSDGVTFQNTLSLNSPATYTVTLKVTAGSDEATDVCTVYVVNVSPGVTNSLTWKGAASSTLMNRPEWMWSGNWIEGAPPVNPSAAIINYRDSGQAVTGRLETSRTIGGLSLGLQAATVRHTLDLNGNSLVVSGSVVDAGGTWQFSVTNGTIQVGSDGLLGNINLTVGQPTLTVLPGTRLNATNIGTIQLANCWGGWGTSLAILDLRGAEVAGGTLRMANLLMHNGGSGQSSYFYLNGGTALTKIEVTNQTVIGQTGGDSSCYIGNPTDQKLPPGISLSFGSNPALRGSLLILRTMFATRYSTAKLVATSGGTCTAYLSSLWLVKHDATIEAGNSNPQTGILDMGNMAACFIDTLDLKIAPDRTTSPTNTDNLVGTLKLPPGTVVAGTVVVGGATNRGVATLECSNTAFRVTNSITLHKTARVTMKVGSSGGLDIDSPADSALSMTTATNGALQIQFTAPCFFPTYGLRWAGDHVAALQALQADGKLVVDAGGLAPKTASIFLYRGSTYVGPGPASGTVIMIR